MTATFAVSNELSKSTLAKVSLLRDSLSYQSATSTVVTAEQRVLVDTLEACVFSGYNFTNEESSGVTSLESSENSTWGAGLGTSIGVLGNADISFGVNGTKTTTKYNVSFIDINGDGSPSG